MSWVSTLRAALVVLVLAIPVTCWARTSHRSIAELKLSRIDEDLDLHYIKFGRLPSRTEGFETLYRTLARGRPVDWETLAPRLWDPWCRMFVYIPVSDSEYLLASRGYDGLLGTDDDIGDEVPPAMIATRVGEVVRGCRAADGIFAPFVFEGGCCAFAAVLCLAMRGWSALWRGEPGRRSGEVSLV